MTINISFDELSVELTAEGIAIQSEDHKEYAPAIQLTTEQVSLIAQIQDMVWGARC